MKKWFVNWDSTRRIKRRIKNPHIPFSQAKNVAIIENRETFAKPEIDELVIQLEREGKQVARFYLTQKKPSINNRYSDYPFTPSDYSLFGQLKNQELTGLISKKYDYVLVFDVNSNLWITNLCSRIPGDCFVGTGPSSSTLLDLQISADRTQLVREFLHYLRLFLK